MSINHNPILFLDESARARRMALNGELSDEQLQKYQELGLVPDMTKRAEGILRAVENLAKNNGATVYYDLDDPFEAHTGYYSLGSDGKYLMNIHAPKILPTDSPQVKLQKAVIAWHEAREAARGRRYINYIRKNIKKYKDSSDRDIVLSPEYSYKKDICDQILGPVEGSEYKWSSAGHNPGVMKDEKQMVTQLVNAHNNEFSKVPGQENRTPYQDVKRVVGIDRTSVEYEDEANFKRNRQLYRNRVELNTKQEKAQKQGEKLIDEKMKQIRNAEIKDQKQSAMNPQQKPIFKYTLAEIMVIAATLGISVYAVIKLYKAWKRRMKNRKNRQ